MDFYNGFTAWLKECGYSINTIGKCIKHTNVRRWVDDVIDKDNLGRTIPVIREKEITYIDIRQKKTGAKVSIPCSSELKQILEKYGYAIPHLPDQDLHPIGSVMPANLGWHASELGNQKYTDRSLPIRLVQIVPNDDPHANVAHADFTVTQIGDSQNVGENIGSCTYYQWGRKDPMIPGVYSTSPTNFIGQPCTDKAIYPTSDYSGMNFYTTNVAVTSSNPDANYGTAIRNPDKAYAGEGTTTSWIEGFFPGWTYVSDGQGGTGAGFSGRRSETAIPYNLWDAYCYGDNSDADGTHKVKTVYDPCPPGFAVPYKNIASSLGTPSAGNGGRYFTQSNGVTQFFPYSGARVYFNVDPSTAPNYVAITPGLYINEVANAGLYWTDCPYNIKTNSSYNASSNWAGPGAYKDHYYSHILTISASSASLTYSTKGTAGIVRPMVYNDPNY